MSYFIDVFEGPQARMHTTHIQEEIFGKTLDVRGSWNDSLDGGIVMNTHSYLSFFIFERCTIEF